MPTTQRIIAKSTGVYFNILAYLHPQKLRKDGFNLFCTPFARKLKPHHEAFLETGKAVVLRVDGNQIQTYRWGNGSKKVVLVHGWASHSFRWKSYIEALVKNDFTVLAFDAPAHGNSTGKIMNLVIYERALSEFLRINTDTWAIIGHSIGAFASTYYLSLNPQSHIKKAVILAAPGSVEEFFEFYRQQLGLSAKALRLIIEQFEKEIKHKPSYFSAVDFAQKIQTEALIIHDKTDKSTKYTDSEKLSRAWVGSTLKITERLGHELKNDDLLQEIIKFIK
ncbi:alpha/beta hydrolase [Emticicia aquatilis]|uniref:Alpha/beta hydrolase n=1 Tax=Emticicia aquatilis TaxID=1537369 RepID=A0A917DL61_9BACT|nr:alpha/beta hydrolase [Emticicia aquatilis]GGD46520.1 alpha/beta hydrolase [Emticicia aquatilis]